MILKESEIDQDNIIPVLGKPYKEPGKLFTATGSSFYFVKEFNDLNGDSILAWEDSKVIFQRYEKGLAAYVNRSNYQRVVLLPYSSIQMLKIKRKGLEMRELLKRYFHDRTSVKEEHVERETILELETDLYRGVFRTSFSSFKSQAVYFNKLPLGERIDISISGN